MTYSNYFYKSIRDNENPKETSFVIDVGITRGRRSGKRKRLYSILPIWRAISTSVKGAVQSVMGAYLLTYGVYSCFMARFPAVGRRPVILVGMSIFMLATLVAVTTSSLTVLIAASAMQGMGTGVGGVMARTLPRDLYERTQLRHANSLLNMGILVGPLLAPLIGGLLD